jgi:hypothetical protein
MVSYFIRTTTLERREIFDDFFEVCLGFCLFLSSCSVFTFRALETSGSCSDSQALSFGAKLGSRIGGLCATRAKIPTLNFSQNQPPRGSKFAPMPNRPADREERRAKRRREKAYQEYDKVLLQLDHNEYQDVASHLHLAHSYRQAHPTPRRQGRRPKKDASKASKSKDLAMRESWTAWPLPADSVPRQEYVLHTFSTEESGPSTGLYAEIESCLLRFARERIKDDGEEKMSAEEGSPFKVTQEVTKSIVDKVDKLLRALGRVKLQQLGSERTRTRATPSRWDEIVEIVRITKCIDDEGTMKRIVERCNKVFKEDINGEMDS